MRPIQSILLASTLLLASCRGDDVDTTSAPQAVRVARVRQADVVQGRTYLAEVVASSTVQVLTRVQGTVSSLPVPEGQGAEAGDVLAQMAAPEAMARLHRARAERERAERERDFVCGRLETDQRLTDAGDMAPDQLEASEKNCAGARLAASAAQAAEDEVVVLTSRSQERAPFAGVVLEQLVEPGQSVMPGVPLLVYGSSERELLLRIPSSDLVSGLGEGTPVVFDGRRGTVSRVGAWARGPGQLVELRVSLDEADGLPTVGATTSVTVVFDERSDSCAVPLGALGSDASGTYLLSVLGDTLERVEVTRGPHEDGLVAFEPCLPPGTLVVVGQLSRLDLERSVLPVEVGS